MARERYLLHTGDEEIHDEDREIKLVTKKDKWDNFWFYYKKHMIVGIILVILAGVFIYDMATKVEPDYTVAMVVGDGYVSEQDTDELEKRLALYGEDLNGDGQTIVSVIVYNLMMGDSSQNVDPEMQTANIVKFVGDLSSNESAIFITDTVGYQYCQQDVGSEVLGHLDGTPVTGDEENMDTIKLPLGELSLLDGMTNAEKFEGYSFSLRYFTPGQLKKEETADMYAAGKAMLDRIQAGTPVAEENVSSGSGEDSVSEESNG